MALIRVMRIRLVHLDRVARYCQMNAIESAAIEHQGSLGRLRLRKVDLCNMRALVKVNLLCPASDRLVSPQLRDVTGRSVLSAETKEIRGQIAEPIALNDAKYT